MHDPNATGGMRGSRASVVRETQGTYKVSARALRNALEEDMAWERLAEDRLRRGLRGRGRRPLRANLT